jgi:hypothetical protein
MPTPSHGKSHPLPTDARSFSPEADDTELLGQVEACAARWAKALQRASIFFFVPDFRENPSISAAV